MRSFLAGDETVGTKIRAGSRRRIAAYATAAPWLPPDAAATPASGGPGGRRGARAPGVRGGAAGVGRLAKQKVRDAAARLDRAGVLQLFELEGQRERRQPEVGAAGVD